MKIKSARDFLTGAKGILFSVFLERKYVARKHGFNEEFELNIFFGDSEFFRKMRSARIGADTAGSVVYNNGGVTFRNKLKIVLKSR
jgi:hypothetical protein